MSDPRVVDVHVHLFQQADDPMRDGYEIWEYGDHDGVDFGTRRGTVGDLAASLGEPPVAHCVVVGMFAPGGGEPALLPQTSCGPTTIGCSRWRTPPHT